MKIEQQLQRFQRSSKCGVSIEHEGSSGDRHKGKRSRTVGEGLEGELRGQITQDRGGQSLDFGIHSMCEPMPVGRLKESGKKIRCTL